MSFASNPSPITSNLRRVGRASVPALFFAADTKDNNRKEQNIFDRIYRIYKIKETVKSEVYTRIA